MSAIRLARGATGRDRDRQVRGWLPRPRRQPARRGGVRAGHARHARLGRGHRGCRAGHDRDPVQRHPCDRGGVPQPPGPDRRDHRRAGRRQRRRPGPPAGLPRGPARADHRQRRAAHLRRGDHRVPHGPGRCAGAVRDHARPDHAGQDHRRRHAHRRLRRPCRPDGPHRARGPRVPGRNAERAPALDGGRRGDARPPDARTCTRGWRRPAPDLEARLRSTAAEADRTVAISRVGSLLTLFFREGTPHNAAEALASDRDAYARFFGAMLDQGILLPPSQFEAWFLSAAHGDAELEATVDAARRAFAA